MLKKESRNGTLFFLYYNTMEALLNMARRITELRQGQILFKTMTINPQLEKMVIQLNTAIQMRTQHVDSNGDDLYSIYHESSVYSKTTEILSQGRKIAGTPYTLFDTGEFFKSFNVILHEDGFEIEADPIKNGGQYGGTNLFVEYGEDILGLTDENMNRFLYALTPQIQKVIQEQIFKGT